jgi:uncharacterized alpha-E superfamily protein
MERADGMMRMASTYYILSLDKGVNNNLTWRPLLETFMQAEEEEIVLIENDTAAVLKKLLLDTENHNSLKVIVTRARENARGIQDLITKEVWEQVNQMYHMVNQPALQTKLAGYEALEVINTFSRQSVLYTGITDITMPRGVGWNFMNLGKYVERCLQTIELVDREYEGIDYQIKDTKDILHWRNLLLSISGYELHLKTYHTTNFNRNVLHQVLVNEDFTRSLLYSLSRIDKYLTDVIAENNSEENRLLARSFGRLYSRVRYIEFDSLNNEVLKEFLNTVQDELLDFNIRLGQNFFSYS